MQRFPVLKTGMLAKPGVPGIDPRQRMAPLERYLGARTRRRGTPGGIDPCQSRPLVDVAGSHHLPSGAGVARICQASIDLAVLDLFRSCGAHQCGGRLLQAELEHRWRPTGFRRDDLEGAIHRLEQRRCLRVHRDAVPGPDIELTVSGYRLSNPLLLSGREWMRTARCYVELSIVRCRSSIPHKPSPRCRRQSDSAP